MSGEKDERVKIFDGIDALYLEVLTLINENLCPTSDEFEWKIFSKFINLKFIHIEGGNLCKIGHHFRDLSSNNVISLTIKQNNLNLIESNSFDEFKSLQMLIINKNLIQDLIFLTSNQWSNLWYLDLRDNQLQAFPSELVDALPAIKVLKLGQNKIRTIDSNIINTLLVKCREFSFDKMPGQLIF